MLSRKRIDFKLWATIILLKEQSFYISIESRILIRKILNSMNHRRYSFASRTKNRFCWFKWDSNHVKIGP
jgi:hypothetical protein